MAASADGSARSGAADRDDVPLTPSTDTAGGVNTVVPTASAHKHIVRVLVRWAHAGAGSVRVTGDFQDWGTGVEMHKVRDGTFETVLTFDTRVHDSVQAFKFIVDGKWQYDADQPWAHDGFGSLNNYLVLPSRGRGKPTATAGKPTGSGGDSPDASSLSSPARGTPPLPPASPRGKRHRASSEAGAATEAPGHDRSNSGSSVLSDPSLAGSARRSRISAGDLGHLGESGGYWYGSGSPKAHDTARLERDRPGQSYTPRNSTAAAHDKGLDFRSDFEISHAAASSEMIRLRLKEGAGVPPAFHGALPRPSEEAPSPRTYSASLSSGGRAMSPLELGVSNGAGLPGTAAGAPGAAAAGAGDGSFSIGGDDGSTAATGAMSFPPPEIPPQLSAGTHATSVYVPPGPSVADDGVPRIGGDNDEASFAAVAAADGDSASGDEGSGHGAGADGSGPDATPSRAHGPGAMSVMQANVRREGALVIAMVGLPARGKTFIARRLMRHLVWIGLRCQIFNVGEIRRTLLGPAQPASFYDPENMSGMKKRTEMAEETLSRMLKALADGLQVGIFDATNTTVKRRDWLRRRVVDECGHRLLFAEIICTDDGMIRRNVRQTKLKSPDYTDMREEEAVQDFLRRIAHYAKVYETLTPDEAVPYIKLVDVGTQLLCHRVRGMMFGRVLNFMANVMPAPHPIWLTRHGQSMYNTTHRIGGDSTISELGAEYRKELTSFINRNYPPQVELLVWTSTLRRTIDTAALLAEDRDVVEWRALDEIDAGDCDGMTYARMKEEMPAEFAARKRDKFNYRYPRGESYQDIVHRLEPVLLELMRVECPVLIVSHQATLRVLYSYLTDRDPSSVPDMDIPLHTLIQLTPQAYGCEEVRHKLLG